MIAIDTKGSYLRSEHRLIAAVGVEDTVVIETGDAVLVMHPRKRRPGREEGGARLKADNRSEHVAHAEVFRPWGSP